MHLDPTTTAPLVAGMLKQAGDSTVRRQQSERGTRLLRRILTRRQLDEVVSQAVSAAQFAHPNFQRLHRLLYPGAVILPWGSSPGPGLHRKVWEFVYVLRAAEQSGVLAEGRRAVGFGVGLHTNAEDLS